MRGHSKEIAKMASPLLGGMFLLWVREKIYTERENDQPWSRAGEVGEQQRLVKIARDRGQ